MNTYILFALVVVVGLLIFPVGFELMERLSIRAGEIPNRRSKDWCGRPFLHWKKFNVHKYGDVLGMVPLIAFVVMAAADAHWTPLASKSACVCYLVAIIGAYLWVNSVGRAIGKGKIARYDWGFSRTTPDMIAGNQKVSITIAGYYNAGVTVLRFAAVGLAGLFVITGTASDALTLCMILSFIVWILTAVIDMQTISLATGVLFLWALLFALIEVCIEREVGWALLAPTWHEQNMLYGILMGGKDLTGYHLFMFVLPFVLLHLPFAFGKYWGVFKWSWAKEFEIIAIYFVMCVCWDFLWFVLNPSFTLERFRPGEIWWHEHWVGRVPQDYIYGIGLAIVATALLTWKYGRDVMKRMTMVFTTFAFLISMTVFFAPVYHHWYEAKMKTASGLTARWNKLSPEKRARLMELIEQSDAIHVEVGELGRDLAQCQQLKIGCRQEADQ